MSFTDDAFGRLVAALKSKGMWDNTLVVVSSDNGGPGERKKEGRGGREGERGEDAHMRRLMNVCRKMRPVARGCSHAAPLRKRNEKVWWADVQRPA